MPKTVILGTARTPIGKLGGGLSSIDATDLGAAAITAALERADVAPPADDVPCTACAGGFFSHRARGDAARQAMVVWLS